jgi:type VI secretion system protein ImpF
MAHMDPNDGMTPSIIDRLIDPDSGGTAWRRGYGIEEITAVVQRDLEDVLNTRQSHAGLPEGFAEVHNSIVTYGLPDFTSLKAVTPQQRDNVGRLIANIITRFEPRLNDIRVTVLDPGDAKTPSIRFRVDARLFVDPSPEVAFDTILELTSGHYSVKPSE